MSSIYTIGHSTRPIDLLIRMLKNFGVESVIDVRTVPKSRFNPQYNQTALAKSLPKAGIEYRHMPELGGLRKPRQDSKNAAWRNASFRGYADYMQTPDFRKALNDLIALSKKKTTAYMCAEAVPWRCHRSLISDALLVRDIEVMHIMSETAANPHRLTKFADVRGHTVTYPGEPDLFSEPA